jgi:hypothetical protein
VIVSTVKKVARQHARRLLAQELAPAWPAAPRCRRQPRCQKQPPDRARRDPHTELQQLARDPRIAPARVLARQPQDELTNATLNRWPSWRTLRLCPAATHQLPVPAEQRLRRHDHPLPASRREKPSKCREEGAIGCSERRPRLLPMEHRQLMPQNNEFDVLGELAALASDEQPQHRGEREVNEGKEHPPMLPEPAVTDLKGKKLVLKPLTVEGSRRPDELARVRGAAT